MPITEIIIQYITHLLSVGGSGWLFILMVMESMVLPVPSEAVMPFTGFLISTGQFSFLGVIFFSTLGSLFGSLISYYIGFYGGTPFVKKFGRYFLLREDDLQKTERFFQKHGQKTIFISRFIPVVRHFISLPAGASRMNLGKFILYTTLGAGLWNAFLTWAGFALKENWNRIEQYTKYADYFILLAILIAITIIFSKRVKKI
ncbi:hypothetical protein COX74_01545 [bacterium (Candidatus Gribaldobacteria) CG_4_10_14_0_2_um_filter_41_16]|uniref:VTT domain-containing protein n=4 Tax=Candidatus Gribaldobacteria TaxID=2798536 RepID=A0A2M7VIV9_9BACT|nr:MAG: hypothetical protein AUJ36_01155 [Parcubacteria group bacterium CG1_02_41_26]PIR91529.1 MAG: hypothetical protein COU03_01795 [bacterium (Candidatus Gribaldobacteria) CG10_big_fil_rev_8_21_14_0_10_41_12]PIV47026.1 MAG: hypothetical protein COS21_02135 [bacterium (Candidatus Gribaldobacteria) CG02_land_8_20_14_3_00_41_15]PIX02814.1 MAG: hypothetical protein COZ78_03700 [bacterium (Candidatus Gribaldobacteria) CG_4_8_14_3_um_filter_42_11]PJA01676.1 MAG: hypothetical protein COX74_01545 [b